MQHLILGTRKGLLIFEDKGGHYQFVRECFPGAPVSYSMRDPRTGVLWACLDHGHWGQKLHRSHDLGRTWEEVPSPKYPEDATLPENKPATLTYLWMIVPGGHDEPQRLYIGTEPGGMFRSDDGGDTFQFVETLWNHPSRPENWFGGGRDQAGMSSIIVDPRDSRHLLVGISVGGVYESTDGGQTWEGRNQGLKATYLPNPYAEYGHDPHFMTASPSNPDVLWQQNHCGVFRSVDSGRTWTDISQPGGPVHFGFPIAVDEQDENVAWVVPAISDEKRMAVGSALCVCRTDDGGQTWKTFTRGLPQENCYDVVFRHALDLHGDRLVFGSTTGNVYLSDDRGESWRCLGQNLPPVYSVRFSSIEA